MTAAQILAFRQALNTAIESIGSDSALAKYTNLDEYIEAKLTIQELKKLKENITPDSIKAFFAKRNTRVLKTSLDYLQNNVNLTNRALVELAKGVSEAIETNYIRLLMSNLTTIPASFSAQTPACTLWQEERLGGFILSDSQDRLIPMPDCMVPSDEANWQPRFYAGSGWQNLTLGELQRAKQHSEIANQFWFYYEFKRAGVATLRARLEQFQQDLYNHSIYSDIGRQHGATATRAADGINQVVGSFNDYYADLAEETKALVLQLQLEGLNRDGTPRTFQRIFDDLNRGTCAGIVSQEVYQVLHNPINNSILGTSDYDAALLALQNRYSADGIARTDLSLNYFPQAHPGLDASFAGAKANYLNSVSIKSFNTVWRVNTPLTTEIIKFTTNKKLKVYLAIVDAYLKTINAFRKLYLSMSRCIVNPYYRIWLLNNLSHMSYLGNLMFLSYLKPSTILQVIGMFFLLLFGAEGITNTDDLYQILSWFSWHGPIGLLLSLVSLYVCFGENRSTLIALINPLSFLLLLASLFPTAAAIIESVKTFLWLCMRTCLAYIFIELPKLISVAIKSFFLTLGLNLTANGLFIFTWILLVLISLYLINKLILKLLDGDIRNLHDYQTIKNFLYYYTQLMSAACFLIDLAVIWAPTARAFPTISSLLITTATTSALLAPAIIFPSMIVALIYLSTHNFDLTFGNRHLREFSIFFLFELPKCINLIGISLAVMTQFEQGNMLFIALGKMILGQANLTTLARMHITLYTANLYLFSVGFVVPVVAITALGLAAKKTLDYAAPHLIEDTTSTVKHHIGHAWQYAATNIARLNPLRQAAPDIAAPAPV